jgi:hypothetical protein
LDVPVVQLLGSAPFGPLAALGRCAIHNHTAAMTATTTNTAATCERLAPVMRVILPDIALAVRAEAGSSLGHLGVGSLAGQVADAAAQYPAF